MNFNIAEIEKLQVLEVLKACDFDLASDKLHVNFSKVQTDKLDSSLTNSTVTLQFKGKKTVRFKAGSDLSSSVNLMGPDSTEEPGEGEEIISFALQYSLKVDLKEITVETGVKPII
jgi:hypothetical protein